MALNHSSKPHFKCLYKKNFKARRQPSLWSVATEARLPRRNKVKAGVVLKFPVYAPKATAWHASKMKNFFYVYILTSHADPKIHYAGITEDLQERLLRHNRGACIHTANIDLGKLKLQ